MSKLKRISQEETKGLRRWDPDILRPFSEERRRGPQYYVAVLGDDGWDHITYYVD